MNIKNLEKLAYYLLALPDDYQHFDMGHYFYGSDVIKTDPESVQHLLTSLGPMEAKKERIEHYCGAVACALGHAALAISCPNRFDLWEDFGESLFDIHPCSCEWSWCFSPEWEGYDNTHRGAADRILYLIEHGPFDFDEYFDRNDQADYWIGEYKDAHKRYTRRFPEEIKSPG